MGEPILAERAERLVYEMTSHMDHLGHTACVNSAELVTDQQREIERLTEDNGRLTESADAYLIELTEARAEVERLVQREDFLNGQGREWAKMYGTAELLLREIKTRRGLSPMLDERIDAFLSDTPQTTPPPSETTCKCGHEIDDHIEAGGGECFECAMGCATFTDAKSSRLISVRDWTPKRTPRVYDPAEDDMCPNCVTPWKCNGPHQ